MTVPCKHCGTETDSTGTKLCDRCWEVANALSQCDARLVLKIFKEVHGDSLFKLVAEGTKRDANLLGWDKKEVAEDYVDLRSADPPPADPPHVVLILHEERVEFQSSDGRSGAEPLLGRRSSVVQASLREMFRETNPHITFEVLQGSHTRAKVTKLPGDSEVPVNRIRLLDRTRRLARGTIEHLARSMKTGHQFWIPESLLKAYEIINPDPMDDPSLTVPERNKPID